MANSECLKKHSSKLNKGQKKANYLEGELEKTKKKLVAAEKAREASDDVVVRSLVEVDVAQDKINKALQNIIELQ